MRVDSVDPEVRRLIVRIADTVRGHGGFIHDDLVIHHDGPSLWTALPHLGSGSNVGASDESAADAPTILRIPRALHVPVQLEAWPDDSDALRPPAELGGLTPVQRTLLLTMVDLFNACDKVRAVGRGYPNLSLADDPELHALITEARPSWATLTSLSPSRNFLKSRLGSDAWGAGRTLPHLMPVIDLINHHPAGASYEYHGEIVKIRACHQGDGDQVFLRYNDNDALAIALNLGYVENDARFVASIPFKVEISGIGVVEVEGVDLERRSIPAPAVEGTKGGLRLVGLQLGPESVKALVVLLALAIRSRRPELGEDQALGAATDVIRSATDVNRDYFERLTSIQADRSDRWGLRDVLRAAAAHQVTLLEGVQTSLTKTHKLRSDHLSGRNGGTAAAAGSS